MAGSASDAAWAAPSGGRWPIPRTVLLVLVALASIVYFVDLGGQSIWDANEAFYVETPREMLESRDFINPTFNYLPRFNKPVLSYWIVALFYESFGVSVTAQRVPMALGALVIIACAFVLGRLSIDGGRVADRAAPAAGTRHPDRDVRLAAGLFAAAGLAAAPRLVMFARRIFIDIWITAFMSLTLACFALSERYPERRRLFLVLMYVAVGLGVLTKGPVAIVLPGLAFAIYLGVHRELGRIREMMIPTGAVIVAAIVVPWYAALHHEHGWMYIRSFVISENLERYTSGFGVRQHRGPWFYLPVVLSDSFPWSLFLFMAVAVTRRERHRITTLLWCWILAIVGFFSFSAGKQDLYIFPIVAAVAALGGAAIARGIGDPRWRGWLRGTVVVAALLLAIAGGAVLWLFETAGRVYALHGSLVVGACGLAGGAIALVLATMRKPAAAICALLAAMVAVDWAFVVRVLPDFERYKPVPALSHVLEQRLQPGDVVAHYQVALPSMVYYLRRHVDQYFEEQPFVAAMQSERRVYAVLSADDYAALQPAIGARTCVIDRRHTFDVKLRTVLARQPLPELLLITNRCR
ncbi:MAG: glycosyltransferase family 39 protein [Acidobacteria bacterium]|nr:glycosyltransferase family 39 protein [Acidobacteriota bacterium]